MLLGVWVIIYPFFGVPASWHKVIAVLTGLVIVFITLKLRPEQPLN